MAQSKRSFEDYPFNFEAKRDRKRPKTKRPKNRNPHELKKRGKQSKW